MNYDKKERIEKSFARMKNMKELSYNMLQFHNYRANKT